MFNNTWWFKFTHAASETVTAVKAVPEMYHMARGYEEACEGATPMKARYVAARACAVMVYGAGMCACVGHKFIGEGWAGPESGGESCSCERCGYSWHHTYY